MSDEQKNLEQKAEEIAKELDDKELGGVAGGENRLCTSGGSSSEYGVYLDESGLAPTGISGGKESDNPAKPPRQPGVRW